MDVFQEIPQGLNDIGGLTGILAWEQYDEHGLLITKGHTKNLITATGDQYYAGRAVLSTSLPAQVTGWRLGTGSTAPAKSGSGSALTTYLSGSNKANDSGFPTAVGGVVTWKRTFAPGEATSASAITEAVLVNDTIGTDATSVAANTISRALISGVLSKAAGDTLILTWTHTLLGS